MRHPKFGCSSFSYFAEGTVRFTALRAAIFDCLCRKAYRARATDHPKPENTFCQEKSTETPAPLWPQPYFPLLRDVRVGPCDYPLRLNKLDNLSSMNRFRDNRTSVTGEN